MGREYESWGRYPKVDQAVAPINWRSSGLPGPIKGDSVLPYGLGRSYGDVCLNDKNTIIPTRRLDRLVSFDEQNGVLTCEAGVSLAEILEFAVPRGWFLSVTPGTKFVTVGGAIANDVHGKNHHVAGTFGRHVQRFELLRSDGNRLECSPERNPAYFRATVGGIGLTGLITTATIKLIPIHNRLIQTKSIKFASLDEFFEVTEQYERDYNYAVAWIDCLARGKSLGRGIYGFGNHAPKGADARTKDNSSNSGGGPSVPFDFPGFALNSLTVKAFNFAYYNRQQQRVVDALTDYEPFFYPLDAVGDWNRIYGRAGFLQYQCVVPYDDASAIRAILEAIARSGLASFLGVLKRFGDKPSPGLLSFPHPGLTLALDFPIKGNRTFDLFEQLDSIVRDAGGRLYSAKDACMSAEDFQRYYPQWRDFAQYIDPAFSSDFWRRVTAGSKQGESK